MIDPGSSRDSKAMAGLTIHILCVLFMYCPINLARRYDKGYDLKPTD